MIHFFVRFKIRDDLLSHYLAKVNCLPSNTSIFKMKHSYSIGKTSHFPPPSLSSRPKLCSNGPPKSWIDDPFFCKIQNQGRSSEPLPRESKLFTFKHVHFQDEALVFHRKDFTLPVQNFISARQSSNCPIPFPPRHVRQSNAREDIEALN